MQQKRAKDLLRAAWAGEAEALRRIRALHPKPPAPDALKLADAQLVVARGYGFESWAAMSRKIDSLTRTPVEQFRGALRAGCGAACASCSSGTRRCAPRSTRRSGRSAAGRRDGAAEPAVLDVLLAYGADLNLKSDWWAGGSACSNTTARPRRRRRSSRAARSSTSSPRRTSACSIACASSSTAIRRSSTRAAATARPRCTARARWRSRGTCSTAAPSIDARDVDHESTPAQYLVRDAPDVARLLVDRGAWFDIFIAVGLRDAALVERCLREDPEALDHRTWQGKYTVVHNGHGRRRAEEIGDHRGDIYRWVFGHNVSAIDAARIARLRRHRRSCCSRTPRRRSGCSPRARAADRAAAEAVVAAHPEVVGDA